MTALLLISSIAQADCIIYYNDNPMKTNKVDPLSYLLKGAMSCPESIQELQKIIENKKLSHHVAMVANRGRNNPSQGSFSFFESISGYIPGQYEIHAGDLFLGYFTKLNGNQISLDQELVDNHLLIEAIAWDKKALVYNFYELRSVNGNESRWYYRGNSLDAFKDNTWLYRQNPSNDSHFGNRMRCSACHNSGGPIMKEQVAPYNDWWRFKRPLILTPNQPNPEVQALINELLDPDMLAKDVKTANEQLAKSQVMIDFQNQLSLQEQLRPLFCTTEINLEANTSQLDSKIAIPSGFWLNPLLGTMNVSIAQSEYEQLLVDFAMHFPETTLRDADNAWLTPVKGVADINAIKLLIKKHLITKYFAQAVLLIDYTHPLSPQRCELLKLVPEYSPQWMMDFINNLQHHSDVPGALTLAHYLTDTSLELGQKLHAYNRNVLEILFSGGARDFYEYLIAQRKAVASSEMSQNPNGQILEPGFRVIFPESQLPH